jgi:hypothetical protein
MYTSNPSGSNQRFLSKLPGSSGPRYETHSQWMSVQRSSIVNGFRTEVQSFREAWRGTAGWSPRDSKWPSLERVRIIPARPERNLQASFKKGQVAETKSFIRGIGSGELTGTYNAHPL